MNSIPGVNIQYPYSEMILSGRKTIETRTYPLPIHLTGIDLAIIETPGNHGGFQARVVGLIRFSESFKYQSEDLFNADVTSHFVGPDSVYSWRGKPKWGWRIERVEKFEASVAAPAIKGIKFTKEVQIASLP